ncbi:MAG: phage portal protein [Deltaproteobacteria bacterium]|nr:phage portal protein [Deltaproteobacteria bacterium]
MFEAVRRVVKTFGAVMKGEVGPLRDNERIWKPLRLLLAGQGITEPYRQHAAVYSCVTIIATNISQVPFNLYRSKGDGKEVVENVPLYKVFTNPNPLLSAQQLWEATAIWYALRGEAVWILERENVAQVPKEIWIFPPDRFKYVLDDRTGLPVGWKYQGKEEIKLPLHQVIFFRSYNPYNDLRGIGPLEAASLGVEQDHWAARHNLAFFRNAAEPAGILTTEGSLTEAKAETLRKRWEDRHGGTDNAHKIAVLEGGLKYQNITLSPRDMEFLEQRRWNREEIAMVFRVPMHLLSVYKDIKAYKGMLALDKGFWQQNLIPKMGYFEGMLFSKLFSYIDNGKVWGEFDLSVVEALQGDFNEKVDTAKKMNEMGWPINAINERLDMGMKPVPWGDVVFVPWNVAPADSLIGGGAKPPKKEGEGGGKGILDEARKDIIWKAYLRIQQPHENRITSKIRRFFFEQRKRVLDALNDLLGKGVMGETKDYTDDVFNKNKEDELLKVLAEPLFADAVQEGIDAVLTELALVDFEFSIGDPAAAKYIESKVVKIVGINDTVKEQIRKALNEGLIAGDTPKELADRIRGVYNFASTRANSIARTESGSCIQGGKYETRKAVNVDSTWITARDEHVRGSHAAQDGETVPVGEKFSNGLRFPGDPQGTAKEIINCRCDTISAT